MPAQMDFQQRLQSVEHLLEQIEAAAEPNLRTSVQELMQLVMDLHGAGLDRMLELTRASGETGAGIIQKLGRDELVASLLVLHGLHPMDIEARVTQALDKARLRLRAHEGEVELLSIHDGAVRLRLRANGQGCGSTAQALKEMVEDAVYQGAPDVTDLVIEVIEAAGGKQGFVPLDMLQGSALQKAAPAPHISHGLSFAAGEKGGL